MQDAVQDGIHQAEGTSEESGVSVDKPWREAYNSCLIPRFSFLFEERSRIIKAKGGFHD